MSVPWRRMTFLTLRVVRRVIEIRRSMRVWSQFMARTGLGRPSRPRDAERHRRPSSRSRDLLGTGRWGREGRPVSGPAPLLIPLRSRRDSAQTDIYVVGLSVVQSDADTPVASGGGSGLPVVDPLLSGRVVPVVRPAVGRGRVGGLVHGGRGGGALDRRDPVRGRRRLDDESGGVLELELHRDGAA